MTTPEPIVGADAQPKPLGMRKNGKAPCHPGLLVLSNQHGIAGKQWHAPRKAFRPGSGLTSFAQRSKERTAQSAMKAMEKGMKDEKEAERQVGQLRLDT